jgi:hypothetical protein
MDETVSSFSATRQKKNRKNASEDIEEDLAKAGCQQDTPDALWTRPRNESKHAPVIAVSFPFVR